MFCKDCGSQLPDRYKFCEVCGAETDSLISENGINNLYLSSVKRKKNQNKSNNIYCINYCDWHLCLFRELYEEKKRFI